MSLHYSYYTLHYTTLVTLIINPIVNFTYLLRCYVFYCREAIVIFEIQLDPYFSISKRFLYFKNTKRKNEDPVFLPGVCRLIRWVNWKHFDSATVQNKNICSIKIRIIFLFSVQLQAAWSDLVQNRMVQHVQRSHWRWDLCNLHRKFLGAEAMRQPQQYLS